MIIKLGIKLSLAAGAVYYLSKQGVWKNSTETEKLYNNITTTIEPYVKEAKAKLPFEVPDLPSSNRISFVAKHYWNEGVMWTFRQLGDLPENISRWTGKGIEKAKENPEIRNFLDSFSNAVETKVEEKQ